MTRDFSGSKYRDIIEAIYALRDEVADLKCYVREIANKKMAVEHYQAICPYCADYTDEPDGVCKVCREAEKKILNRICKDEAEK